MMDKKEFQKTVVLSTLDLIMSSIKNVNRKTIRLSELQRVKVRML